MGAALGYVGAVARRASQPGEDVGALRAEAARWQARAEELSHRVESAEARSVGDASVLQALSPVRVQLEQMTARVDQMEATRAPARCPRGAAARDRPARGRAGSHHRLPGGGATLAQCARHVGRG